MAWTTPKTDWDATDHFNISDFNRIKNNLSYLYTRASSAFYLPFDLTTMGSDITNYSSFWNVDYFNAFETNLYNINRYTFNYSIGTRQTFYANGTFITYDELNRIESATLQLYNAIETQLRTLPRLAFTLGAYRKIRV